MVTMTTKCEKQYYLDNIIKTKNELIKIEQLQRTRDQYVNEASEQLGIQNPIYLAISFLVPVLFVASIIAEFFPANRYALPDGVYWLSMSAIEYGLLHSWSDKLFWVAVIVILVMFSMRITGYKENRDRIALARIENATRIPQIDKEISSRFVQLQKNSIVPIKYLNTYAVSYFEQYIHNGQANNINECISVFEGYINYHRDKM